MKGKDLTYGVYRDEGGYFWMVNSTDEDSSFNPFCVVFGGGDSKSVEDLVKFAVYSKDDFMKFWGLAEFERVL